MTIDQDDTFQCPECGETGYVDELVGFDRENDSADIVVGEHGFIGDCPGCFSQIFLENTG
jgi:hypothetical protein